MGKNFDIDVVHKDRYIITKIRYYGGEIKTDFHDDELPPEKTQCLTYSVKMINTIN